MVGVLVDTNVLLRRTQPAHEHHTVAVESIARLLEAGEPVHFTLQNIAEFWSVVTRPIANNGLGFSTALAAAEVQKIERFLTLLPDTPALYGEWKHLVARFGVIGVNVHDARLVAAMRTHEIDRILTFNVRDFARYGIGLLHPSVIAA